MDWEGIDAEPCGAHNVRRRAGSGRCQLQISLHASSLQYNMGPCLQLSNVLAQGTVADSCRDYGCRENRPWIA